MALEKETDTRFGIAANYWRVESFRYIKSTENILEVTLGLHPATGHTPPLECATFSFNPTSEELSGNLVALCYTKAKELNEYFNDAKDV